MGPDIQNPYGAVTDVLKESRLSLRDIMADYMMGKKMEQDLTLAKAKADTETAMIGANMERDRLVNLRDLSQMAQRQAEFEANQAQQYQIHGENLTQRKDEADVHAELGRAGLDLQKKRLSIEAATAAHVLERKPISAWMTQAGIDPRVGELMGFKNLNQTITRDDARYLVDNLKGFVPHMESSLAASDMRAIEAALPAAKPEDLPALQGRYETAARRLAINNQRIKGISDHDKMNMAVKMQSEGKSAEEVASFISDLEHNMQQTKSAGEMLGGNIGSFHDLRAKIAIDPLYNKRIEEASNAIRQAAPAKLYEEIKNGVKSRIARKDFQGVYDYLRENEAKFGAPQGGMGNKTVRLSGYAQRMQDPDIALASDAFSGPLEKPVPKPVYREDPFTGVSYTD